MSAPSSRYCRPWRPTPVAPDCAARVGRRPAHQTIARYRRADAAGAHGRERGASQVIGGGDALSAGGNSRRRRDVGACFAVQPRPRIICTRLTIRCACWSKWRRARDSRISMPSPPLRVWTVCSSARRICRPRSGTWQAGTCRRATSHRRRHPAHSRLGPRRGHLDHGRSAGAPLFVARLYLRRRRPGRQSVDARH